MKIYDDPFLCEMAADIRVLRTRGWVIGDLKDIVEDIRRSTRALEDMQESISDCPHCKKMIDLYKIKSWGDKKFAESFNQDEGVCDKDKK